MNESTNVYDFFDLHIATNEAVLTCLTLC